MSGVVTRGQLDAAEAALLADPAVAAAVVAKARAAKSAKKMARALFPDTWLVAPASSDKDQRWRLSVVLDGRIYSVPVESAP